MIYRSMVLAGLLALAPVASAQDSVDVTFRYTNPAVSQAWLVGEFNSWNNQAWPMTAAGNGLFTRTARLRVGGNPAPPPQGVPGAWQYKFYFNGASPWPGDPLNPRVNSRDNNNSYLYTNDPTILYLSPNQLQPAVHTFSPVISAYLFPKVGAAIDTGGLSLTLDGVRLAVPGSAFDPASNLLSWALPGPVASGAHTLILTARSTAGSTNSDSATFVSQPGYVQILTHGGYATRNPSHTLHGTVQDSSVVSVRITRNGADTLVAPVANGVYRLPVTLREGANAFVALADSSGVTVRSDPPVTLNYVVDHAPRAAMGFVDIGTSLQIFATGSTDPDSGQAALLTYSWSEDPANPSSLGIAGSAGSSLNAPKPQMPGLYAFGLVARDPDGNADTTRNYFVMNADHSITVPGYASNPPWVRAGRIYFLFPKEVSPQGTLNAAALRLQYIRDMGFSIIWLMPVMKNADPINLGGGPGYNITDFSSVAPEYGTNQDLKAFVDQAHALGLKVILDITPNHSSSSHPWSVDAHQYREDSRYWSWYEHTLIPHDTHGLGQSADAAGFVHYDGWDVLLDLNWSDVDLRTEMINVFRYWIKTAGVDGFRFDVYWGPSLRYGEAAFGKPVREALKHVKPDILLLGETDGTGSGTERYYADYTGGTPGGVDAAYDWSHFSLINGFGFTPTAINNLHAGLDNSGFYPGPDALYLRYMENQDEDRIAWVYSNNGTLDPTTTFRRTMVMASILFTAPGLPELWNGQEVGFGYGIASGLDARRRGLIDWNFQGKSLLTPHYQKLATIRGQFPAFTQHKQDTDHNGVIDSRDASDFVRVSSTDPNLYAFLRPYADQNGLTVVNVSSAPVAATLDMSGALFLSKTAAAYLNDLYGDTHQVIAKSSLSSVPVQLPPYGTAIFTVSATSDTLKIQNPILSAPLTTAAPDAYALGQNYPNPFNPSTVLRCRLPVASSVRLAVYDMLGRQVAVLMEGSYPAGDYVVRFDGSRLASGVYLSRFTASPLTAAAQQTAAAGNTGPGLTVVKKMLLVK